MAYQRNTACAPLPAGLDRSENLAHELPTASEAGADEVDGAALPVAVSYPDWRLDELREKYAAADAYEPDQPEEF